MRWPVSTDELMGSCGLTAEGVRRALYDLERVGIASNDTVLTAFVHVGVEGFLPLKKPSKAFDFILSYWTLLDKKKEKGPNIRAFLDETGRCRTIFWWS